MKEQPPQGSKPGYSELTDDLLKQLEGMLNGIFDDGLSYSNIINLLNNNPINIIYTPDGQNLFILEGYVKHLADVIIPKVEESIALLHLNSRPNFAKEVTKMIESMSKIFAQTVEYNSEQTSEARRVMTLPTDESSAGITYNNPLAVPPKVLAKIQLVVNTGTPEGIVAEAVATADMPLIAAFAEAINYNSKLRAEVLAILEHKFQHRISDTPDRYGQMLRAALQKIA